MPIYEYRCQNCNETFEVRQKFSDEPVAVHAACGGDGKRLLSTPQFHFKGTGFYITDYGKGGAKDPAKPAPAAKTETKTESAPAAASTPAPATTKSE